LYERVLLMNRFDSGSERARREIEHGRIISRADTEEIWGWNTPAGRLRARRRGEMIMLKAGLQPTMNVLEIGCGTGLFTAIFAQSGARILAVDISRDLINKAVVRNLPSDRVQFSNVPFEDEKVEGLFDAVVGSSILHHLDIEQALRLIFKLLLPGGIMSFAEPNMLNPQIMIQKNVPWLKERLGDSPDETAFFPWGLGKQIAAAGFSDVEVIPFDWLHPLTPKSMISAFILLGSVLEKVPMIRNLAGSLLISARKPAKKR